MREVAEGGGGWLDADTAVSPDSYDAALLAAGAGIMAVDRCLDSGQNAFMLVRPPGHHAFLPGAWASACSTTSPSRPPCAREAGLERVLIVDWDVHHGNGTQAAFYGDPRVLFFSMHEAGHYPGTGMAREGGGARGRASPSTCRCRAGAGDGAVRLAFESLLLPVARAFRPQLVLVSAGYDPQEGDPLGGLRFSRERVPVDGRLFARLCRETGAAGRCASWRAATCRMMAASIVATMRGMQGEMP